MVSPAACHCSCYLATNFTWSCPCVVLNASVHKSDAKILAMHILVTQILQSSPAWVQVVEDFGLLRFTPLAIEDKASVQHVLSLIDKANGYVFAGLASGHNPYPAEFVYGAGLTASDTSDMISSYQERYVGNIQEHKAA